MLESLELPVFPSCYNCISWSEDGELALAAGESVQVLTPKSISERGETGAAVSVFSSNDWNTTRFRANVFTSNEWPNIFPQARDQFSLGAEQSLSTVAGVAWSAPGLAKYRRCVLAVLTSNLILSLYAPVGAQGKWTRIAIVNKTLESHFHESIDRDSWRLRKSNIRSFTWLPPLKIPRRAQADSVPENRWGSFLIAIANDDNDVVFVQVQPPVTRESSPESLRLKVVAATSLHDLPGYDRVVQHGSVFASALQSQSRILSLASGPWLYQPNETNLESPCLGTANIAAAYGTTLKLVKLATVIRPQANNLESEPRYQLSFSAEENSSVDLKRIGYYHFTGPITWAHKIGSGQISIAAGVVAGLALIDVSENAYMGRHSDDGYIYSRHCPLIEFSVDGAEQNIMRHYERISGMTVAFDPESVTPTLHFGTVGGYMAAKVLLHDDGNILSQPPWKNQVEDLRERYDIDRDLGGLTILRVWGLASIQGLVAVAVTMHPGDMVEYRTNAEERLTVVFSTANGQPVSAESLSFLHGTLDTSPDFLRMRRDFVLQHILRTGYDANANTTLAPKVLYAAACCAIVQSQSTELLSDARKVLEGLAAATGVDMTDEISKCSALGGSIDAKSEDELRTYRAVFEKCEICDAGIAWYSAQEAQCASGHMFVRCSLTSLAIQEPGISKFCSNCKSEYIDEDLISPSFGDDVQQACRRLSNIFDTCIYCNGKFRP